MKKVPKYIKDKILGCANYYAKANKMNEDIRQWLEKNKALNDFAIDHLIDCVELATDKHEAYEFILFLENQWQGIIDIGNKKQY